MELDKLLQIMVEKGASDLFITAGVAPSIKVHGKLVPITKVPLAPEQARETVFSTMSAKQREEFEERHECNFAISARGSDGSGSARFTSAICAGWCCGVLKPTFPNWKISACRRSSRPSQW